MLFPGSLCVPCRGCRKGRALPQPPLQTPGCPQHRDPQQRPHPWGHLGSCCWTLGGACFGGVLLLTPLRSRKLKAGAMHQQICATHCDNCIVTLKEEEEGECSEAWGHSVTHPGPLRASIGTSISVGPQGSPAPPSSVAAAGDGATVPQFPQLCSAGGDRPTGVQTTLSVELRFGRKGCTPNRKVFSEYAGSWHLAERFQSHVEWK